MVSVSKKAAAAAVGALLVACSAMQERQIQSVDSFIQQGAFQDFALELERKMGFAGKEDLEPVAPVVFNPKFVLEHLEAAESWRLCGRYERSLAHFDAADAAVGDIQANVAGQVASQVVGAIATDVAGMYVPNPVEAIMINYYKALLFLAQGKPDLSRVELNRADDRARRTVERFSKEIEKAQKEADEAFAKEQALGGQKPQGYDSTLQEQLAVTSTWKVYRDFVVPPAVYLHALFLAHSTVPSDREKAIELYERLREITDRHPVVVQDLADLQKGRICPSNDCVWVMVERGLGPTIDERKITLPIPVKDTTVLISIALPEIRNRFEEYAWPCSVEVNGTSDTCLSLAATDVVVRTELAKRYPGIVTRALVSAFIKGFVQYQLRKEAGLYGALAGFLITEALTAADRRIWRQMPGDVVVYRFRRDPNGEPAILRLVHREIPLPVNDTRDMQLIHVKLMHAHHEPHILSIPLTGI